jgi:iron(II)-dependent oxidoreductase
LPGRAYSLQDLVGNVWQGIDEFEDAHTRVAIVCGGSNDQPQNSIEYFPQAYRNEEHSKVLLMAPSYDRFGGVGFRCVRDTE